jgi:hypothetical protein
MRQGSLAAAWRAVQQHTTRRLHTQPAVHLAAAAAAAEAADIQQAKQVAGARRLLQRLSNMKDN